MAQKRKAPGEPAPERKATTKARAPKAEPVPAPPPLPSIAEERRASPIKLERGNGGTESGTETSQQALTGIAQDAVLILRRGLSYRAELALENPGSVSMGDCIALLRLTTELGAEARKGEEGLSQQADYSRLAPAERVQLAALLLKVDYA